MEIGAIEEIYPCEERKQEKEEEETLNRQLTTLKPQVISSLANQTYSYHPNQPGFTILLPSFN